MKKSNNLTIYIIIAMIAGAILGYYIHENFDKASIEIFSKNIKLLTTIFLRLIQMVIAPLVFTTLVVGISRLGDLKTVGRVGRGVFSAIGKSFKKMFFTDLKPANYKR